jgi:hypothetical protein
MNWKAYFSEEDKSKTVKFLNLVAKHAKWSDIDTGELIEIFKHLQYMQQVVLPKMENNILEIKQIVEAQQAEAEPTPEHAEAPGE